MFPSRGNPRLVSGISYCQVPVLVGKNVCRQDTVLRLIHTHKCVLILFTDRFHTISKHVAKSWPLYLINKSQGNHKQLEPIHHITNSSAPCTEPSPQTSADGDMVPQITVSPEEGGAPLSPTTPQSSLRESVSTENLSKKKEKKKKQAGPEMPPATVITMKGALYQKATFSWDKRWCVFTTDTVLYIASSEASQRPLAVLPITTDSKVVRKKGPDRYRHAVQLVAGGKKELMATDSESEFNTWIDLLESAAGCAQIQELLSEDEEDGGEVVHSRSIQLAMLT